MLQFQVVRICKVLYLEETLCLAHTFFCQICIFILFIDNIISGFLLFLIHENIHLGKFFCSTFGQLSYENITHLIQFSWLATLTGNDKWCSRLIDQYRIHLIDDRIMKTSLYKLLLVYNHVITQIIKSKFIISCIRNVTVICLTALIIIHII